MPEQAHRQDAPFTTCLTTQR